MILQDYISTREAPVWLNPPLHVPVMLRNPPVQPLFPRDYPVEHLREAPMIQYDRRWNFLPVGVAFPGDAKTVTQCELHWNNKLRMIQSDEHKYTEILTHWIGELDSSMTKEVATLAQANVDYLPAKRANDILSLWDVLFQASVGGNANDVCGDMEALLALSPKPGTSGGLTFLEEYATMIDRILARGLTSDQILEAFFSSRLIAAARNHSHLNELSIHTKRQAERPLWGAIKREWDRVLISDSKNDSSEGAVSANMSVVAANVASTGVSSDAPFQPGVHSYAASMSSSGLAKSSKPVVKQKFCFNCMEPTHLIRECPYPPSVCPECKEHHHKDAHRFIVSRRRGNRTIGSGKRYTVKSASGIKANLAHEEIEQFADQAMEYSNWVEEKTFEMKADEYEQEQIASLAISDRVEDDDQDDFFGGEQEIISHLGLIECLEDRDARAKDIPDTEDMVESVHHNGLFHYDMITLPSDYEGSSRYGSNPLSDFRPSDL